MAYLRWLVMTGILFGAGCAGEDLPQGPPPEDAGMDATVAGCADQSLTYATFGQRFLDTYCNRCHGFTQQSAQTSGSSISAAAGTGTFMPRGTPTPTAQERAELVTWIACGAP
jgi:hypothetical protein